MSFGKAAGGREDRFEAAASGRYRRAGMTAAALLWLIAAVRMLSLFGQLPSRATQVDYSVYYLSGYLLRHGDNPYSADLNQLADRFGMNTLGIPRATDPPTFLAMFEPLTLLSPQTGFWVWTAINALALAAALWMLLGPGSGLRPDVGIALAALAVMYPAVVSHVYYGQNKVQILLLLVLTMRWLEARRDGAAGLALALAGLMRIFPLLLVGYLVIERRWRAVVFTAIGLIGGLIATGFAIGFRLEWSFVNGIDVLTGTRWLGYYTNVALGSFVSRLYWDRFGVHPGSGIETLRHITVAFAELDVLALACLVTLRSAPKEDSDSRIFCLWVVSAIMLSPTAWIHYMVLLFIPFARICSAASRGRGNGAAIALTIISYALLMGGCPWGCLVYSGEFFHLLAWRAGLHIEAIIWETATLTLLLAWAAALAFAMSSNGRASEIQPVYEVHYGTPETAEEVAR